jgi:GMP synthase-like glutamine amidotransferase
MRVLVLKPHELADPGLVGEALRLRGADLLEHVLADEGAPPALDGFDALVVMGAPWSVDGDEVRDWIDPLLERLREAVAGGVPVLGICFGAQAFAQATGGWVARAADTEVGLHRVDAVDDGVVAEGPWFMWHGDTFGLPPGATRLASTPNGPQAYALGPHLLVQFHPEATADIVRAWIAYDDGDFRAAGLDPSVTLDEMRADRDAARDRAAGLVDAFLRGIARLGAQADG